MHRRFGNVGRMADESQNANEYRHRYYPKMVLRVSGNACVKRFISVGESRKVFFNLPD